MDRKIVFSALLNQVQVGLVEGGRLVEYYLEQESRERLVNNIYKGRVENILPGMAAAFVDIGLKKNAFFFLADLPTDEARANLRRGDALLVQVAKEAEGTKGPRVTTQITLPGRFVVLLPQQEQIGLSKQIVCPEERERLKELARECCPPEMGLIVRTAAQGCSAEELRGDVAELVQEWNRIEEDFRGRTESPLLYRDHDLIYRVLRDLYRLETTELVVDSLELKARVEEDLADLGLQGRVELYQGKVHLFTYLGLDRELQRARRQKVWLDCGGYLIFNQTEALLTIDVNTGKYVGRDSLADTVLKTNLEAAAEIAHQLRLRNIGGMVIIDFIHMTDAKHRQLVLEKLEECLGEDKTRTNVLGFTKLGLVELTRKRVKLPLDQMLEVECPHCQGRGRVDSHQTTALQIAQEVYSLAREEEVESIEVRCSTAVAAQLIGPGASNLERLQQQAGKVVRVSGEEDLPGESYELSSGK